MIVLYILLAIILLLAVILSIKVSLIADYRENFYLKVKYLFLEIPIYPGSGKKKPKEEKPAETPKEEPAKEEKPTEKGKNPIKNFLDNEGVSGVIGLVNDTARILGGFFGSVFRHVIFEELYLTIVVAGRDAADTAIKYGRVSSNVFPALGFICSHAKVKKYDADISPDFLAEVSTAEFHTKISFRPIFLLGALLVLAVKLLFKVIFKLLFSKPKSSDENINKNKIKQGGAQ